MAFKAANGVYMGNQTKCIIKGFKGTLFSKQNRQGHFFSHFVLEGWNKNTQQLLSPVQDVFWLTTTPLIIWCAATCGGMDVIQGAINTCYVSAPITYHYLTALVKCAVKDK